VNGVTRVTGIAQELFVLNCHGGFFQKRCVSDKR
jgi:hypothetical protein